MNQSTFESSSRVLLAIAVAALAGVLAFGGNQDAIAQTRTAQCDGYSTKKDLVAMLDAMLAAGKSEFFATGGGFICGW
jgi:hypothetical protein